jgi:hypothetical protein
MLIIVLHSYSVKAKEASKIFKSRPSPSIEILRYVQLVIDTGGAQHLRSPALQVPLLERYYLDVWFLAALLIWFLTKVVKVIKVHLKDFNDDKKNK